MAWDDITSYPWLTQPANPGESFSRGVETGARLRQTRILKEQNQRDRALFPIRRKLLEQQLSSESEQVKQMILKREQDAILDRSFTDVAALNTQAISEGWLNNPTDRETYKARLWQMATRNPKLRLSPVWTGAFGEIKAAEDAERQMVDEGNKRWFELQKQREITDRWANRDTATTTRQIQLENLRASNRQALERIEQEALSIRRLRYVTRGEWQQRHTRGIMDSTGLDYTEAVELAGDVWDRLISPYQTSPKAIEPEPSGTPTPQKDSLKLFE